ncbi:hypothetical protein NAPIS_ORF02217 [Vairimorpha apis BRL 01]|uniref:Uncharacterized protein n=1 Tax=Vairimorpha apis BRL 01 TaxID=1037528 RepID=T0M9Y3_9MICR|nr:hypothetical protein NAPIS_ORF02217 [Vairimorpha apis BRL 01]
MTDDDLNFNYPKPNEEIALIEKRIKNYLRKYSINLPKEKDIERYTDKYTESVLVDKQSIKNYLYPELLSPELNDYFGFSKTDVDEFDKENISDLEWESDEDIDKNDSSSIDGDYRIEAENDEDSKASSVNDGEVF